MRLHRGQPTGLRRPWDSPGKNTGVGCHLFLKCMKVKSESELAQLCPTLSDPMDCSLPGSSVHGIFQARVLEWGAIAFSVQAYNNRPIMVQGFTVCGHGIPLLILTRILHSKSQCYPNFAAAAAKSLQSCLTLCDPIDGSPSGSPIPGILQARTLEWVSISFSNA